MNNLNKIATLASKLHKKPNKAECYDVVKKLIESPHSIAIIADVELAVLYQFFTPAKSKKAKSVIDWCQRAVAKEDLRGYLNYLYSDGTDLFGCDGHRAHIARNMCLAKGFYDKNGCLLDDDKGTYPDIARVCPNKVLPVSGQMPFDVTTDTHSKTPAYVVETALCHIQVPYFDAAVNDIDIKKLGYADGKSEDRAMWVEGYFDDIAVNAVVMGVKKVNYER